MKNNANESVKYFIGGVFGLFMPIITLICWLKAKDFAKKSIENNEVGARKAKIILNLIYAITVIYLAILLYVIFTL